MSLRYRRDSWLFWLGVCITVRLLSDAIMAGWRALHG